MFRAVEGGASSAAAASRSTDAFAFGTLAWEVLAGASPWKGHSEFTRLAALLRGETLDVAQLPISTPPAVRSALERCLSADRSRRPRMAELRATLERELQLAQNGTFDVFLSHSWGAGARRKPLTDALYAALRGEGLRVWLDSEDMGADLQACMREGIAVSAAVVVLASPDYAASANCMFELREAAAAGKPIVTCCVEPGFWRAWPAADGSGSPALTDSHELVTLARLKTHLYCDFGAAARADWGASTVSAADAATLRQPEALPRLLQQLRDVLPAQALARSASMRKMSVPQRSQS